MYNVVVVVRSICRTTNNGAPLLAGTSKQCSTRTSSSTDLTESCASELLQY